MELLLLAAVVGIALAVVAYRTRSKAETSTRRSATPNCSARHPTPAPRVIWTMSPEMRPAKTPPRGPRRRVAERLP